MTTTLADELLGPALAAARTARAAPQWWATLGESISFTIAGEPASKANSRQIVMLGKGARRRPAVIKSAKARAYERTAALQIPKLPVLLQGPLAVTIRIWYASERPDLDASVILDVMQGRIYRNDRQCRDLHLLHGIDRANPRAEVTVQPLVAQQAPLF
jgi:Holliday junction resolvase RusA-like endonuclease